MTTPRQRVAGGLALVAAIAALAWFTVPRSTPVDTTEEQVGPLGVAGYEEKLGNHTGLALTVDDVVERAQRDLVLLEARMDELAGSAGGEGWRPVFRQLQADHPESVALLLEAYRDELDRARSFSTTHDLVTVPDDPLEIDVVANAALRSVFPLALYLNGRLGVTASDDASLAHHCTVCIPPLAVHEGYPGHHVAFSVDRDVGGSRTDSTTTAFFHEGWAQYAEWLMLENGYFVEVPELLGALHLSYLRALRALTDAELHAGRMTEEAAEARYQEWALLTPEAAEAEVARHFEKPTLKASYWLGALQVLALRQHWLAQNGVDSDLRLFHDQLLGEVDNWSRVGERLGFATLPWPDLRELLHRPAEGAPPATAPA